MLQPESKNSDAYNWSRSLIFGFRRHSPDKRRMIKIRCVQTVNWKFYFQQLVFIIALVMYKKHIWLSSKVQVGKENNLFYLFFNFCSS